MAILVLDGCLKGGLFSIHPIVLLSSKKEIGSRKFPKFDNTNQ